MHTMNNRWLAKKVGAFQINMIQQCLEKLLLKQWRLSLVHVATGYCFVLKDKWENETL